MTASTAVAQSRVLIVDDNLLIRRTLTQLINQHQGLIVCGHASSVDEGTETAVRLKPDLALIDLTLGNGDGLPLIRQLRERLPQTRILVLSMHEETVFAFPVLRAGADGFVMKQKASQHLFEAIRAVLAGQVYVSSPPPGKNPQITRVNTDYTHFQDG
jgi:DNA-binding NarL/FixJ family response regulator